ncbi:MAG: helix-turn-helix domain-containing protein [Betaproteobacteria bacterium]|nr:helix-turn-helix domain-containing protein [Betaproteobacteria bacterium]
MVLDQQSCYQAVKSHDARFDGRFFTGVTSTGIYCRPVCSARVPKREHCRFFGSAAAAEGAGFRPCLRCRPELAPGNASVDASQRLAQAAASLIEDGIASGNGLAHIAAQLNVTDRHLRRVFEAQFGVAPVAFAQTQRLLLAKRLLTDTAMSATDVAFASGFQSLRRFNALFRERYRLSPSDLRKRAPRVALRDDFAFELAYRPPLDWARLLAFLAARSVTLVENVHKQAYRRTLAIADAGAVHTGWIEVLQHKTNALLQVRVAATLAKVLPQVLARVKRVFDLSCQPQQIAAALGPWAKPNAGLRLPGAFDGFELAVRAVLGQQITVRAATTLAGRFAAAFGDSVQTPYAELQRVFPPAPAIAERSIDDIAKLGIIATRAKTIRALAQAVADQRLTLDPSADVEATLMALKQIPGIGEWTAQYIAMRALAWPDAFPHIDYGVMKAMNETNAKRVLARAEAWRPWRGYAVMHLWHSLKE